MYALLLAPPVANPFYPPLGLPSLAAFIKASGRHHCTIADLSIEAVRHMLTPSFIADCRARIEAKMQGYWERRSVGSEEQPEYFRVARALVKFRDGGPSMEEAMASLGCLEYFNDSESRRRAIETIDDVLELACAAYEPYKINRSDFSRAGAPYALEDLVQGVREERSPLAGFLEKRVRELVAERQPDVIGISINYYGQLIAGLELARFVREAFPGLPVVVGGSLMPEVAHLLAGQDGLSHLFDYVICYEGETALLSLLDALGAGDDPWARGVPNLMGKPGTGNGVRIRHKEAMATLPVPDFDDLDLGAYLSPVPILPLLTSRGCYWGSCAFCTHFHTYGDDYRTLQPSALIDHIETLKARHDCRHFYFVDESLAPSKALAFSRLLLERNVGIAWGTEIRFERALSDSTLELMARSGCKALSFGLESGSQRVLDLMGKGISVEDVDRILDRCDALGIAAHAMCIIGFPGETEEDCAETLAVIERHHHQLALLGFSPFTLNVNSIVYKDPGRFGITITETADILRPDRNFLVDRGLSQAEAYAIYDRVTTSRLVIDLDERTAVATREHLLLLDPEASLPRPKKERDLRIVHHVLPFSLAVAEQGEDAARLTRQARLIGTSAADVQESVERRSVNVVVMCDSGRILEIDDEALELLSAAAEGRLALDDPRIVDLLRILTGDRSPPPSPPALQPHAKEAIYA